MFETALQEYGEKIKQEGLQQGSYKRAVETAKKMLKKGYADEEITELTGLKSEEVKNLRGEIAIQ